MERFVALLRQHVQLNEDPCATTKLPLPKPFDTMWLNQSFVFENPRGVVNSTPQDFLGVQIMQYSRIFLGEPLALLNNFRGVI